MNQRQITGHNYNRAYRRHASRAKLDRTNSQLRGRNSRSSSKLNTYFKRNKILNSNLEITSNNMEPHKSKENNPYFANRGSTNTEVETGKKKTRRGSINTLIQDIKTSISKKPKFGMSGALHGKKLS